MPRRPAPTPGDYMVIALAPAMIMLLIGSLAFFVIAIGYDGDYVARLKYVCALFVFAAVLIGRISIEEGTEHATLFALPLALAVLAAFHAFAGVRVCKTISYRI